MIVLDTNALLRWIEDANKLSKKVKLAINKARKEKAVYISSISVWEIYILLKKGKLVLNTLPDNWLQKVEELSFVHFVPVDNKISVLSVNLVDFPHKDPADRIIIATALVNNVALVTSDQTIRKYKGVQTVW
jgi:PIN domain nuclease of toxin-antitoxin system